MLTLESQRSLKEIEQIARSQLGMVDPEVTATLVVPRQTDPVPEAQARCWLQSDRSPDRRYSGCFGAVLNKVLPLGGVEAGTVQR